MRKKVTMREALADPALLGDALPGASWFAWRCLLIAIVGELLETDEERAAFKDLTGGREVEPGAMVELFMAIAGRRSGKTKAAAVLSIYLACLCDWSENISIGEQPRALFLAPTEWQAEIAFGYATGIVDHVELLRGLVTNRTANTITLNSGIILEVAAANARHIRGTTAICCIADEVAFLPSAEDSANRDVDLIVALRPSLATTSGLLVLTSSPSIPDGNVYDQHKRHFGPQGHPAVLVVHTASKGLNPSLSDSVIERAYEDDPQAAASEYGAEFRQPVAQYLDRAVVEAVAWGETERGPIRGARYLAFADAAGGGGKDSFTLAIGHVFSDGDKQIAALDCLMETRPPFDADIVVKRYCEVLRRYGLREVIGDKLGGDMLVSFFGRYGIGYQPSAPSKSELYLYAVPLFMAGRISLLSQPRLVDQFVGLRRKVLSGGREEVDHARGQHDDCANAVVGLVWRLFPPQPAVPLVAPIVVVGGQVLGAGPLTGEAARRATAAHVQSEIEQIHREASHYATGSSGGGTVGYGWRRFDYPGGSW